MWFFGSLVAINPHTGCAEEGGALPAQSVKSEQQTAFSFHGLDTSSRWALRDGLELQQPRITVTMDLIYRRQPGANADVIFRHLLGSGLISS